MITARQNNYLCALRDSGVINMFGAAPYLAKEFGLGNREAQDLLLEWMKGPQHDYISEEVNNESE